MALVVSCSNLAGLGNFSIKYRREIMEILTPEEMQRIKDSDFPLGKYGLETAIANAQLLKDQEHEDRAIIKAQAETEQRIYQSELRDQFNLLIALDSINAMNMDLLIEWSHNFAAVAAERAKLIEEFQQLGHVHHGEWCISPKKFIEWQHFLQSHQLEGG
jgi:hypothetical protein